MKYICHTLIALLLLSACSDEHVLRDDGVNKLDISFAEQQSRSIWNDKTDTDDKVVYVWENSTDMLTAIKHGSSYVPFYESLSSPAQYFSDTKFETVDPEKSKIKLETLYGVKYDVADNAYVSPVSAGDEMYCLHPINEHTAISNSADAVAVDMHLPSSFSWSQLINDLSPLREFSYVFTSTTIQSVNDNNVVANASHFNSACAILRFNITNNISSDIIISGIKMEAADGSKIFPDVLRFADGNISEQPDKSGYYSRLTADIGSVTIPRTQKGVFYDLCFPLDGDFNSVPLTFTIDTNYLTYRLTLDSNAITNHKFEAGKIYTFNFSLQEKEVHLNIIEIAQCTTYNIDNAQSLNIIVDPDAIWDQTGDETAQMVFVSLGMSTTIDGTDYDVLWATYNLGAMEPIETGNHYAWGEISPKESSLYSPEGYLGTATTDIMNSEHDAVKAYLGDGFWFWCMPTQQMWQDIIDQCTWKWKTVKKNAEGSESEDNINFDASVWEVSKRDADNKLIGIIYLPITGYSGYDESTGTYGKVKKARCQYWTSTPCTNTPGATAQSWAFETTYVTEAGSGNGYMTTQSLKECDRYNGYSIRPVLLKMK